MNNRKLYSDIARAAMLLRDINLHIIGAKNLNEDELILYDDLSYWLWRMYTYGSGDDQVNIKETITNLNTILDILEKHAIKTKSRKARKIKIGLVKKLRELISKLK